MVHYLQLDDLLSVLDEFPKEKEKFHYYKDHDIKYSCLSCKSPGHLIDKCPFLMYNPRRDKVYYKYNKLKSLFLSQYLRKRSKKYRLFNELKDIQDQAESFIEDLEDKEIQIQQSQHSIPNQSQSQNQIQICEESVPFVKPRTSKVKSRTSLEYQSSKSFDSKLQQLQQQKSSYDNLPINIPSAAPQPQQNSKQISEEKQSKRFSQQMLNIQKFVFPQGGGEQKDSNDQEQPQQNQQRHSKQKIEDSNILNPQLVLQLQKENSTQKKEEPVQASANTAANFQNINQILQQILSEIKNTQNLQINTQMKFEQGSESVNKKSYLYSQEQKNLLSQSILSKRFATYDSQNDGKSQKYKNIMNEYGESYDMDIIKLYEFYFPFNNANIILQEYYKKFNKINSLQKELIKQKRKLQNKRASKYYNANKK